MVAFEARKRQASPFRCTAVNIALPFSFIDSYRKYSGKEVPDSLLLIDNSLNYLLEDSRMRTFIAIHGNQCSLVGIVSWF